MVDVSTEKTAGKATVSKSKWPEMFKALEHRDLRLLLFGLLFSNTGMSIRQVAQGWLVLELTNSAFLLGLVGALTTLPMLLLAPLTGVLTDRLDRRKLLLASQAIAMIAMAALATLIIAEWIQVWHVFVFAVSLGLAMAFYMPSRQAFVPELVSKQNLMNAIALNSAVFQVSRITGPALAGGLILVVGMAGTFYTASATYAIIITTLLLITYRSAPAGDTGASMWQNLKEGLAYIRGNRLMLTLLSVEAVPALFGWPYQFMMPVFAKNVLEVGPGGLGLLMAATGCGSLAGALVVAALSGFRWKGLLVLCAATAFGAFLILFALSPWFYASLAILVLVGGVSSVYTALNNSLIQWLVPNELRGRVMSFYMLASIGLWPVGSLQAGFLADAFGAPFAVATGGVMVVFFSLAIMAFVPKLRQL